MGSVVTVQDCINMYEKKTGYLIITAGKVHVIQTGRTRKENRCVGT